MAQPRAAATVSIRPSGVAAASVAHSVTVSPAAPSSMATICRRVRRSRSNAAARATVKNTCT
jgi:hypothetical protein